MNEYKVINCDNGETVYTGDFYQARAYTENHIGDLTVMEIDADVADRLERRAKMLASPAFQEADNE